MGERGKVRRMVSSSSPDVEPEGEEGGIWRRGQDHFRHFTSLLEKRHRSSKNGGHHGRITVCRPQVLHSLD